VFKWASPERLATRYKSEMEFASGGWLKFEIVEWRNLNEIYAQLDGHRYTPDEYTFNRRNGAGWHKGGGQDYPRLLAEQGVPALIDAGKVDEVWIFSDHYFGLWEASMAGPGAFFINGGVYPEVLSHRPFAFYGFNYERGVAEMMHDACHRTEATLNRVYGQWNLKEPKNNWEKFSANDSQSGGAAGVGTCHWPANATGDYDYQNERTVESWADDFLNYPKLTFAKKPTTRAAWFRGGTNFHLDYMAWYFSHLPRAAGVNEDGRQNNWWKYMMDFQNYSREGKPLSLSAKVIARDVFVPRSGEHRFLVAYSGATPVEVASIDGSDLVVTGPAAYRQAAKLVEVSDRENGTHRVATYAVPAPEGGWKAEHRGAYHIAAQADQVRDTAGKSLAAGEVGSFQVATADFDALKAESARIEVPVTGRDRVRITGNGKRPDRDVTADAVWSTADAKIATVDANGVIRGVKAGTTTITATLGTLSQDVQTVVKETGAPRAEFEKGSFPNEVKAAYEFSVKYTAEEPLTVDTIGFGDVRIVGPNAFQQFAEFVSVSPEKDFRTATAIYRVSPAGGTWYASANGVYTIEMKAWQVGDEKARFVPEGTLGTFTVNVKEAEPAGRKPPTTAPEETLKKKKKAKNAGKKKEPSE
jgi:hypothetical protein